MKARKCLFMLMVMVILAAAGCHHTAKTATSAGDTEQAPRHVVPHRIIHPLTGRIETLPAPNPDPKPDVEADKTSPRYVRMRNPETGQITTVRLPAESETAPVAARRVARTRTTIPAGAEAEAVSRRSEGPQMPVAAESKPKPHEFVAEWKEQCSVQEAFEAAGWVLEDLGLAQDLIRYNTQQIRNPQTGRMETRRVSSGNRSARSDALSAAVEGRSTAGIQFDVRILLNPPKTSVITIQSTSQDQPEAVLERQTLYLKGQISKSIQQEPVGPEVPPYPDTILLPRIVEDVYNSIYAWAERQGFERDGSSSYDKYYRGITCKTGSNIRFEFTMRLVDANQTKLEINTLYYEGKDEFKLILQSLMDVLDSLKTATPRAAQEKVPYPKTLVLNCSVDTVADAISGWIGQMSFKGDQTRGDQFYRYLGCRTGSGIRLWFEMRLIGENKTRLLINASGYANKEEFPMILKSFEDILAGLDTETGESLQSN